MYELTRRLTEAYWPLPDNPGQSADRASGDKVVDSLTLGELAQFYAECTCGPTYCLVTERVETLLKQFPPFIERRRQEALNALEAAQYAYQGLRQAVEQVCTCPGDCDVHGELDKSELRHGRRVRR